MTTSFWMFDEETVYHLLPDFQAGWDDLSILLDLPAYPLDKGFTAYSGKYSVRINWRDVFPELPPGRMGSTFDLGGCICERQRYGPRSRNKHCLSCNVRGIMLGPNRKFLSRYTWEHQYSEPSALLRLRYMWINTVGIKPPSRHVSCKYYSRATDWLPLLTDEEVFIYSDSDFSERLRRQSEIIQGYNVWIDELYAKGKLPLPLHYDANLHGVSNKDVLAPIDAHILQNNYLMTTMWYSQGYGTDSNNQVTFNWYNPISQNYYKISAQNYGEPRFGFYQYETHNEWLNSFYGKLIKISLLQKKQQIKTLNYPYI